MKRWTIDDAPTSMQLHEIAQTLAGGAVVLMPARESVSASAIAHARELLRADSDATQVRA